MDCIKSRAQRVERPIRVVQFGEGNFLRAFVDYMLDIANEKGCFDGNILIVKPIAFGTLERFERQDNLYTVMLRGRADGKTIEDERLITSIAGTASPHDDPDCLAELAKIDTLQYIVSNTTEAGIALTGDEQLADRPAMSFPGKLTQLLYARFNHFNGAADKGVTMLPVELIEANGKKLKECVLKLAEKWNLGEGFTKWLNESCRFCSTLVDRIVTGHPKEAAEICERLGYQDELLDVGEPFGLWVVECDDPEKLAEELPLHKAGLPVIYTDNQKPYRERKVRILNGAHTSTVAHAMLSGIGTVGEALADPDMRAFMRQSVFEEILPTLDLPREELTGYAEDVLRRFANPYIRHEWAAISLNSVSKFRVRVLPSLLEYERRFGRWPHNLTFSLARLIELYRTREVNDDPRAVRRLKEGTLREILSDETLWGQDISRLEGPVSAFLGEVRA